MMKNSIALFQSFASVWCARYLNGRNRQMPFVYLDITDRCNSACLACDIWKVRKTKAAELTTDEILSLKPALKRLKTRLISIGGGEPTLRDDLETCIAGFRDIGLSVHINTNALKIDCNRAKSLVDSGLSVVYISCDHPDPEGYRLIRGVDGLNRVIDAVKYFRSLPEPIPVGINITVSQLNKDVLERLVQRCVEWGVQKIQFNLIHTHLQHQNMDKEIFNSLLPKAEDIPGIRATLRRMICRLRKLNISTNSEFFINHLEKTYVPVRPVPCVAGFLYVIIDPHCQIMPCYQNQTNLNIRGKSLDKLIQTSEFQNKLACVKQCKTPCWDTGSAEPGIRFYLPYLAAHPYEICQQAKIHLL